VIDDIAAIGAFSGQKILSMPAAFGLPEVLVAVSTLRLSCKRAGKPRTLTPVWDSSGESRSIGVHSDAEIAPAVRDPRPGCRCLVPRGTWRRHQAATGGLPALVPCQHDDHRQSQPAV